MRRHSTRTASTALLDFLCATTTLVGLVHAFLPIKPHHAVTPSVMWSSRQLLSKTAAMPTLGQTSRFFQLAPLTAAGDDNDNAKEEEEDKAIEYELEHELAEGTHEEKSNPVDDVFNSVPFLTKRKEAMEKEMASIDENMGTLAEQYEILDGEWSDKVAFLKKDYESLKARYYNDTQEVATTGRSNVFVEIMSVVDDFERARMAYKPTQDEEKEILESYEGVKDAIVKGMMAEGLEEVKTVGEPFDFKLHDCMFTEQSMEYPEDVVTREFSKGFMIGGKVVRPAKVACSLGPGP